MPTQSETLLSHAGLGATRSAFVPQGTLFDCIRRIRRIRRTPDEISDAAVASQLDAALSNFLSCMFHLDQAMLERVNSYAVSRVGCSISDAAQSCQTSDGRARWLRLRLILDLSWDAILAGDMRPYAQNVGYDLRERGVEFGFA